MDTLHRRFCWARRAEVALGQDDPALALEIVERLIATAAGLSPGEVIAFLWKVQGEALAALGRREEAVPLLRAALEQARTTEQRFLLWRIHASLGWLYRATNHPAEAESELSTARELIQELAGTVPDATLRENLVQRACHMLGVPT